MADINVSGYVENVVMVVVAVIVVCLVAYPVISGLTITNTTLKTIVDIIPVFLVIAILMAVAKMLYDRRSN